MNKKILKFPFLILTFLFLGCIDDIIDDIFKESDVTVVNAFSEILEIDVNKKSRDLYPHYAETYELTGRNQYRVVYNGAEEIKLSKNKNHIYYATSCSELGYLTHTVETHEINIVNLSDLDISEISNTLTIHYDKKAHIIKNILAPCTITHIKSLDDFVYSNDLQISMAGGSVESLDMNDVVHTQHDELYPHLVSLDVIIFDDYTLKLIPVFSYSATRKIKDIEIDDEIDDESQDDDWDWD